MKLWGPQEGFALGFVSYLARPCSLVLADCCYFHFLYRLGTETPIWGANPDEDGVVYLLQDCPHLLHVSMCPGNESNVDRVFHFYSTFIQSAFCFFHLMFLQITTLTGAQKQGANQSDPVRVQTRCAHSL